MRNLKIEKTITEEKETIIIISKWDDSITVTTHDPAVFRRLLRVLGTPTEIFPRVNKKLDDSYISGASWTFHYYKNEKETNKIFRKSNYITRKKVRI